VPRSFAIIAVWESLMVSGATITIITSIFCLDFENHDFQKKFFDYELQADLGDLYLLK